MDNRQNLFQDPKKQIVLISIFSALLFGLLIILQSRASANDMAIKNQYAYTAWGKAGVGVFRLGDNKEPEFLRFVDTPGDARAVQIQDDYAYLADGRGGLRIYDLRVPEAPDEIASLKPEPVRRGLFNLKDGGSADGILIDRSTAYLPYGDLGLVVVSLSNPGAPVVISRFDVHGAVKSVAVMDNTAYLAVGNAGIVIADSTSPQALDTLALLDTPGSANDLDVFMTPGGEKYLLVADGSAGVQVIAVTDRKNPKKVKTIPLAGYARRLFIRDRRAYVTVNPPGMQVLDLTNELDIQKTLKSPAVNKVNQVVLNGRYGYLLEENGAISVLDLQDPKGVQETLRIEYPGKPGAVQFGITLTLLLAGFIFWGLFFSQFVLPIRNINDRWEAIKHFILYWLGEHGPATLVANGVQVNRTAEIGGWNDLHRRILRLLQTLTWPFSKIGGLILDQVLELGSGVIVLDAASSGMLRTPTAYTRPVGPGVVFTKKNEYLESTLDLRQKTQFLGPRPGEDCFLPQAEDESGEDYRKRQSRRQETNAFTKDGVELVPNVIAVFRLNGAYQRGGTPYGYNPTSTRRAVIHKSIDPKAPGDVEARNLAWSQMPAYLVVDLWREYLSKYSLSQLFEPCILTLNGRQITGLQMVNEQIRERLKRPLVTEIGTDGTFTERSFLSPEYKILQERGLNIIAAVITNLHLDDSMEEGIAAQWRAAWDRRMQKNTLSTGKLQRTSETAAEREALFSFVKWSAAPLADQLGRTEETRPDVDQTVSLLLEGAREESRREDMELWWQIGAEIKQLDNILWYIRSR